MNEYISRQNLKLAILNPIRLSIYYDFAVSNLTSWMRHRKLWLNQNIIMAIIGGQKLQIVNYFYFIKYEASVAKSSISCAHSFPLGLI